MSKRKQTELTDLNKSKQKEFKNQKKKFKLSDLSAYGYILPLGILLISFYVIPIIMSFYFSFTKYNIMTPAKFIGFKNYARIVHDKTFIDSLKNTLCFTIGVVPIQTILALCLAVFLTKRGESKIGSFVKGVIFIPVISSMILTSIIWRILLNEGNSPINSFFTIMGLQSPKWLGEPHLALITLMIIAVWKNVGYFMVIYISGLMDIPKSYYEAARVDGASSWKEFWHVTVPLLKPTTIMVVFLGTIWSFQTFDLVYTLTGGGPGTATMTMVVHIYNLAFKQFNAGYAMAVANILFFIIAIISIFQKKFFRKDESNNY